MLHPMTPASPADADLRAAAVLDEGDGRAAALLAEAAARQHAAGRRVRGLLMTRPGGAASCNTAMVLVDIEHGDEYLVSQALGSLSTSCRADPAGFARASVALRRALDEGPELMVVNRFGMLEAEGGGFRDELLEILSRDLPLLTVVHRRHLSAWAQFTGGAAVLPPDPQALQRWLDQALSPAAVLPGL